MKTLKRLLLIFCVAAVIFASFVSVGAVGFDAEKAYDSVFVIYSGDALGSGFAIGKNCIITNAHVIEEKYDVKVSSYSGDIKEGVVVAMDKNLDIAVIGVKDAGYTPLAVGDVKELVVGSDVYAIGAPKNMDYTLTKGVVSSKERSVGTQKYIQTDAAINSGNSGGPLLNDNGEVVGVNSMKVNDAEGIGLAIPIDTVVKYLKDSGIKTDEKGNVTELTVEEPTQAPSEEDDDKTEEKKPEEPGYAVYILAIVLVLSVILNIVLIIILVSRSRKDKTDNNINNNNYNNYSNYNNYNNNNYNNNNNNNNVDSSERTDFEIDIID